MQIAKVLAVGTALLGVSAYFFAHELHPRGSWSDVASPMSLEEGYSVDVVSRNGMVRDLVTIDNCIMNWHRDIDRSCLALGAVDHRDITMDLSDVSLVTASGVYADVVITFYTDDIGIAGWTWSSTRCDGHRSSEILGDFVSISLASPTYDILSRPIEDAIKACGGRM